MASSMSSQWAVDSKVGEEVKDEGTTGACSPPSLLAGGGGGSGVGDGLGGCGAVSPEDSDVAGPEAKRGFPGGMGASHEEKEEGASAAAPLVEEMEEVAPVAPEEPPPLPANFLHAVYGDEERAKANWQETLRWRKENEVEKILKTPQPNFQLIKKYYPWYYHRYDKKGNVCVHYKLGRLRLPRLQALGIDMDELSRHNMFYQEYLWTVVMPRDTDKVTIIFDLKDLTFADVSTEVLHFLKGALSLQSRHWPARTERSYIINAPTWFSYVFALIRPLLNQRQRDKLSILDESCTLEGLKECIEEHNIPKEYGGTSEHAVGECEIELGLWDYVKAINLEQPFREEEDEDNEKQKQQQGKGVGGGIAPLMKTTHGSSTNNTKQEGSQVEGGEQAAALASTSSSIYSWWFPSAS